MPLLSDEEVFGTAAPGGLLSDEDVFGAFLPKAAPPARSTRAGIADYLNAANTALATGVVNIGASAGTVLQDPGGAIVSGALGARAGLDRGMTALINAFDPEDPAVPHTATQRAAQVAAEVAADRRAANAAEPWNVPARMGKFMEEDSRRVAAELQAQERSENPALVAQQEEMTKAQGFTGNLKAAVQNPLATFHTLARSAPDMALGVGMGATVARAGGGIGAVSAAGTASEAASSGMQAREGTYQQVAGMPLEQLANSPRFQEIAQAAGDPVRAREILANELADQTPLLSAAGTAAGTLLTNRLFGGDATAKTIMGGERMTARELGRRVAQDTVEEGLQGVPEDTVQHGAEVQADPSKEWDPGGSLAQNMVAGFAMGAGGHGQRYVRDVASGMRAAKPDAAAEAPPPAASPAQSAGPAVAPAPVPAESVATGSTAQAEEALLTPAPLTALDRVTEIDGRLAAIAEQTAKGATDAQAQDLATESVALAQERDSITSTWPKAVPGADTSLSTEAGVRLDARYALMDADSLVTSHDENLRASPLYPPELQPRDRSRSASEMQVSGIVQKLDPARLGVSADAATGAPIVGADGLVESGNGRTIALKRVYQANGQKADDYRQFLRANAGQFGLTPETVEGMAKPVLVRVRTTPVNRAEFARQANASTVQRMSPSEQALSDAKRLTTLEGLNPDEDGNFASNRDFIRQFMATLPITEQSDLIESDGRLSTAGYRRIQNAVLARAYGDSPSLRRMTESLDNNLVNVSKALVRAAPTIAAARERMDAGTLHQADIAPDLLAAVEGLSALKEKGWTPAQELGQGDLTGPKYSPEAAALLEFLDANIRSPRRIAEFIGRYYEALEQHGDPSQPSMFGDDVPSPARADLLTKAKGPENGDTAQDPQRGIDREAAPDREGDGRQSEDAAGGGRRAEGDATAAADAGRGQQGSAEGEAASAEQGVTVEDLSGEKINREWTAFAWDSGTLDIPRAEMPQIKAEHRGALVNFLKARDVDAVHEEVLADSLKPTQAEYSPKKVAQAKEFTGGDRSILVSSDSHVLDGHHQWLAKLEQGEPIKAIRLDAPIAELLPLVAEFPSASQASGATEAQSGANPVRAVVDPLQEQMSANSQLMDARVRLRRRLETAPVSERAAVEARMAALEDQIQQGLAKARALGKAAEVQNPVIEDGEAREDVSIGAGPVAPARTAPDTPGFARWFKGSKVVDDQGNPLVMYHGTSGSEAGGAFTSFDTYASNYGLMGQGGYFTANPEVASSYTTKGKGTTPTVYPVYLSIKKPLDMDAEADPAAWQAQFPDAETFHERGTTNESWYRAAEDALRDQALPLWEGAEIMQDGLRAMGFDGITHVGGGRVAADGVRHRVFIAFDPEQIKSATGNNGQFDPTKADIRLSRSPDTKASYEARIDALFADAPASRQGVRILDRSDVMGLLGHANVPLVLNESHVIHDGLTNHPEMTAAAWKRVPDWIENPAAVYTDPNHPGRLTVVAPERLAGYPVVIAIEPNPDWKRHGHAGPMQLLVTAFAKTTGDLPSLGGLATAGRLLYADTKKAPEVWRRIGDIPRAGHPPTGAKRILTEKHLGGWRRANSTALSFAGSRAATADTHSLVTAQDRLDRGEDAETVRRETGWHRGVDGKWRFEISDADAKMKIGRKGTPLGYFARDLIRELDRPLNLGDVLDHPALFAAYPALRDYGVTFVPAEVMGQKNGSFSGKLFTLNDSLGAHDALSTLLHEIQHGIQSIEGFATGSNPASERDTSPDRDMLQDGAILARLAVSQGGMEGAKRVFAQRFQREPAPGAESAALSGESPDSLQARAKTMLPAVERYRRQAGEVEARNTQARRGMTDAQRRATPPSSTADVADADVIVTYNGKEMADAPLPANVGEQRVDPSTTGLSVRDLATIAQRVRTSMPNMPTVHALSSPAEAPEALQDYIREQGAWNDVEGALHQGDLYLFASGLRDPLHAEFVLAEHEAAHFGLRALLGPKLPLAMRTVFNGNPEIQRAVADLQRRGNLSDIEATEEVLVDMPSDQLAKLKGWRRVVSAIQSWLASNGFDAMAQRLQGWLDSTLSDQQLADLMAADLVRAARDYVAGKVDGNPREARGLTRLYDQIGKDLAGQEKWMTREAKARGYKSVDDLLERNYGLFEKLGALWKITHADAVPVFSRAARQRVDEASDQGAGDQTPRLSRGGNSTPPPGAGLPPNRWQQLKARVNALTSAENVDKFLYEFQDKLIDLKRLRDHIQGIGGTINDLNDAYQGEELYHKRVAKRTEDFLSGELKPLLADMRSRGITLAQFEQYLHARHAPEANKELSFRNPNQQMIDAGKAAADAQIKQLELALQRAQAAGTAVAPIEKALDQAMRERDRWNGAQAFKGTEGERLSLSGMSDADAAAIMAAQSPRRAADMKALAARVDAINAKTLDALQSYGLMDAQTLQAWRSTYQHYVPLHRDEAHPDSVSHPIGQGYSVKGDAGKRRAGSNEKVTHILGHIAMQREAALTRGEKNMVGQKLYLMAAQNPDPDWWQVDRPPKTRTVDSSTGLVVERVDPLYKNRPNVIMVRIAGADAAIVFNERNERAARLAESLRNLDAGDLHYVLGWASKATRWFASVNTQYNPVFGVINFARDVQGALLNLGTTPLKGKELQVARYMLPALRSIYQDLRAVRGGGTSGQAGGQWGQLWDEMQNAGGTTGYRDLYADPKDRAESLEKAMAALERGKTSQFVHGVLDWLSDYNETMEGATRLAAYKAALDMGMSQPKAASLAKNLTVNFNRKGRQAREIGALYAFFNAAVQGTARMMETLRGPTGKKVMLGGVLLGAMNALIGLAMMGGDDGEENGWMKIPEFVRERSLVIPLGREDFVAIPLPLGFNVLPNLGRKAVEAMSGLSKKSTGAQLGEMLGMAVNAFNPFGAPSELSGAQLALMLSPTVTDPGISLLANKDWTGKPIFRENTNTADPVPGHLRSKDTASTPAKEASLWLNKMSGGTDYRPGAISWTPDQIDFVIGQLTGGVGRELMKVNQMVATPFTGDELPAHKIPLLGRLYGNVRGPSAESGDFYENIRELNELENELKGRAQDGGDVEGLRAKEPLVGLIGRGAAAERQIQQLRKQRNVATKNGDAARVKEINEQIGEVMKDLNREVARGRK